MNEYESKKKENEEKINENNEIFHEHETKINENESKKIWEGWLPSNEFKEKLLRIRDRVILLIEENKKDNSGLKYFTPHDIEHCRGVEDLIHRLIPGYKYHKFLEVERFYLLASAWLHDIGMLPLVAKELTSKKELEDTEIRERHHIFTAEFIVNQFTRCGVDESDKEILSNLCRFHTRKEDINECNEKVFVNNVEIRLRLLAAYLRLADSLHIGSSRTPADAYAICLTYNIHPESKIHWIKSILVNGVLIDDKKHEITVEFKHPYNDTESGERKVLEESNLSKLDYITRVVMDDFKEELSTISNVLTRNEITYYLDIKKVVSKVHMSRQILNDIRELSINYDIMVNPSASKILEMILVTISNIGGFMLKKDYEMDSKINDGKHYIIYIDLKNANFSQIKQKLASFIDSIENNILIIRQCHLGLKKLVKDCKVYLSYINEHDYENGFVKKIVEHYWNHLMSREKIRYISCTFFKEEIERNKEKRENKKINILLFGYSDLVLKAICGFRDYIINSDLFKDGTLMDESKHSKFYRNLYNSGLEKNASDCFNIFICDGQPKTQTQSGDKLLYHDGFQYGLALSRRNFSNIIIVPDITVNSIIEKENIDYILVGANGLTNREFKHSAGHGSVIKLAMDHKRSKDSESNWLKPKIILVVTKQKYIHKNNDDSNNMTFKKSKLKVEGINLWQSKDSQQSRTRDNIWFTKDSNIINELKRYKINLFNPREDTVPIGYLDYIISDIKDYPIIDYSDDTNTENNIAIFVEDIEKTIKIEEEKKSMHNQ